MCQPSEAARCTTLERCEREAFCSSLGKNGDTQDNEHDDFDDVQHHRHPNTELQPDYDGNRHQRAVNDGCQDHQSVIRGGLTEKILNDVASDEDVDAAERDDVPHDGDDSGCCGRTSSQSATYIGDE